MIDGEIISKMGQKRPHPVGLNHVVQWLLTHYHFAQIQIQAPITIPGRLGKINEPEPDIALTEKPADAYKSHPTPADVLLLVEIAHTTLRSDRGAKARLYARAGVSEYWVVDIPNRRIHCHRSPKAARYTDVTVYAETDTIAPLVQPEASVRVADLLPAE